VAGLISSPNVSIGEIAGLRVNGLVMDFWVLGVIGSVILLLFVWLVVWLICCFLGVLLCRCLILGLRSSSLLQPPVTDTTLHRLDGAGRTMIRQLRSASWPVRPRTEDICARARTARSASPRPRPPAGNGRHVPTDSVSPSGLR
jgi:hypothetical protein